MAKNRPSVIDGLELAPTKPAKATSPTAEVMDLKAVAEKSAKGRDVQHTSVYIPRAAYERMREIAFHERAKIHDLIMEGVDSVIATRGHGETARLNSKAS